MSDHQVIVIGGGGHARVVISTLQAAGRIVTAIVDDDPALARTSILGVPVVGDLTALEKFPGNEAIIAVGDNQQRRRLAKRLDCTWAVAVHPSALVHHDVVLGPGTVVFAGAVVQPGSKIGAHVIVNTAVSVDHDCVVGDFAHLAPGAHLGGNVTLSEGCFVGIGGVVLPRCRIGGWSVLGAGAVAIRDTDPGSVAVGVPASYVKPKGNRANMLSRIAGRRPVSSMFIGPHDRRWTDVLRRCEHDFYHLPDYVSLAAMQTDGYPMAFYAESDCGRCLIPVIMRDLPQELNSESGSCDLTSPYGYACPLFTAPPDEDEMAAFLNAFQAAAAEIGACTVALRLHPILKMPTQPELQLMAWHHHGDTVCIDLTRPEEELWRQTRKHHRQEVERLEGSGFTVVIDDWALYGEFVRLYGQTMARLRASEQYLFDERYLSGLKTALGSTLHLSAVLAPDGRVAAAGLFPAVNGIVQYHLSASDIDFRRMAPTKLLLHAVRQWAKQQGHRVLHLGGGVGTRNDSLFDFKAGFSPGRAAFTTFRMIPDERRYAALMIRSGFRLNPEADLNANYFPPYRASLTGAPRTKEESFA